MLRRFFAPALLTAVTLCIPMGAAHAQLTIEELELYLHPATNGDNARTFRVRNDAVKVVQASIAIEDWDRSEEGVNRFYQAGTQARSCSALLKVFPRSLRLEPGASANVRVALDGADSLHASCWSIVFVESKEAPDTIGRQLTYTVRTGVKVYVEPQGMARDGQVEDLALVAHAAASGPSDAGARDVRIAFRNLGGVQLKVKGAVEVRRTDNSLVQRTEMPLFPVLPGDRRIVTSAVPTLPKGKYVILALLDFGGSEIAAGQIEYEVR